MIRLLDFFFAGWRLAFQDIFSALQGILSRRLPAWRLLAPPAIGLATAWVLYVPIHELLHVAGCLASGGTVTEVKLAPLYGGALLHPIFPFIVPSSEETGRVTGFSPGSDLGFLATDFAPYLLTIGIGVPLLRSEILRNGSFGAWVFGPAVILAAAPFMSLTGDYYEMGSILVTMPLPQEYERLRSDDLFRLVSQWRDAEVGIGSTGAILIALSLLAGICLASWTYRLGVAWTAMVHRQGRAAS